MFTYIACHLFENKIRCPEFVKIVSYKSYNLKIIIIYTYHERTKKQNDSGFIKKKQNF